MPSPRRPLIGALFDTDWSWRFESFTAGETRGLETFNDLMWDTTGWSFFQQPARFHFRADAHGTQERLDHAGREALRAADDDFRQLWLNDEPASHHAINAILRTRVVLPGAYEHQAAERYAREALMPEEQFLPVAGDPPAELAARFNVPIEQIDSRLVDLAARLIDA